MAPAEFRRVLSGTYASQRTMAQALLVGCGSVRMSAVPDPVPNLAQALALKSPTLDYSSVWEALPIPAALLDTDGVVCAVNRCWGTRGHAALWPTGSNYIEKCAPEIATGIRDVLAGRKPRFSWLDA